MHTIDNAVLELSQKLKNSGLKITVAESCTGGGLAFYMTNLAGSSDWFERGFVTYSNQSKIDLLNVSKVTLDKFGAVSEECVLEMAAGALQNSDAEISIAITGIAGPTGGSPEKPVGTVWFGIAYKNEKFAKREIFLGSRDEIRKQAILTALKLGSGLTI